MELRIVPRDILVKISTFLSYPDCVALYPNLVNDNNYWRDRILQEHLIDQDDENIPIYQRYINELLYSGIYVAGINKLGLPGTELFISLSELTDRALRSNNTQLLKYCLDHPDAPKYTVDVLLESGRVSELVYLFERYPEVVFNENSMIQFLIIAKLEEIIKLSKYPQVARRLKKFMISYNSRDMEYEEVLIQLIRNDKLQIKMVDLLPFYILGEVKDNVLNTKVIRPEDLDILARLFSYTDNVEMLPAIITRMGCNPLVKLVLKYAIYGSKSFQYIMQKYRLTFLNPNEEFVIWKLSRDFLGLVEIYKECSDGKILDYVRKSPDSPSKSEFLKRFDSGN